MDKKSCSVSLTRRHIYTCLTTLRIESSQQEKIRKGRRWRRRRRMRRRRRNWGRRGKIWRKENKLFSVLMNEEKKNLLSKSVRFSRERKFPEWLRTNSRAGRSENININRCQTTEKCSPTHRRPKGYWQVTWHHIHTALSGSEGGRVRSRGASGANYGAKWATWGSTGRSCSSSSNTI